MKAQAHFVAIKGFKHSREAVRAQKQSPSQKASIQSLQEIASP